MKVSELTFGVLDYWVAQTERSIGARVFMRDGSCFIDGGGTPHLFAPSLNWAQGGPIIERERIAIIAHGGKWDGYHDSSYSGPEGEVDSDSPIAWDASTALIAAMRAYVASKFGDEVPGIDT